MAASSGATLPSARSLSRFCGGLGVLLIAALEEGVGRQPAAYLLPGSTPSLAFTRTLALLAGAFAAFVAWRSHAGFRALSWGISGLASSLAVAGGAWFLSFGTPHP